MPPEPASSEAPLNPRAGHTVSLILFLTVFVDLLGFGIVIPFLPLFAERLHIGAGGIGALLASYSLMQLLCAPILGRFSDRFGRRPILLLGLLGSGVGYLVYGFAATFAWLLFARALHGVFAATVSTAQAYVADTTAKSDRTRGMGLIGAAFGLGFVLGPALGGLLGVWGLRVPVFFASILSFANLWFAYRELPESHQPDPDHGPLLSGLLEPWQQLPRTLAQGFMAQLFGAAFLLTAGFAALEATFALLATQVFGYGAAGIGGLLAAAGLLQALTQGYLVGKIAPAVGEVWLALVGALLMVVGLIPLGLISAPGLLFLYLALAAVGYGLGSPAIASLISQEASAAEQGQVLGVNQSALSLARIFGPLLAGALYQIGGPATTYIAAGLVSLGAAVLLRALARRPPD